MRPLLRRALVSAPLTALAFCSLPGLNPALSAPAQAEVVAPELTTLDVPVTDVPATAAAPGLADAPPPSVPGLVDDDVEPFRLAGVSWEGDGAAGAWLRVQTDAGWGQWTYLPQADSDPDPGSADDLASRGRHATEPLWVGEGATGVEVKVDAQDAADVSDAEVQLIEPGESDADPGHVRAGSASAADKPGIITRAQWGADESLRTSNDGCSGNVSYAGALPRVSFVHHTAGSNTYTAAQSASVVRGIYAYHVKGNGWCDVGYNFIVDKYGQVFEGRAGGMDKAVIGAHAGGFNTGSFGVSVLGEYTSVTLPAAGQDALARLIAWKLSLVHQSPLGTSVLTSGGGGGTNGYAAGTKVTFNAVSGHRDTSPGKNRTACPGNQVYGVLGAIRAKTVTYMNEKTWLLREGANAGPAGSQAFFGDADDVTLACDFDGDGRDTFATYDRGSWLVRTAPGTGPPSAAFAYGDGSTKPVCGDWNGDGKDGIGVFDRNGWWFLRETATGGAPDRQFDYGWGAATPVVGDWNGGTGPDGVGIYAGGRWLLRSTPTHGAADAAAVDYGWAGATPVPGDWDGNGTDTLGIYDRGGWWLRDAVTPGPARSFAYGSAAYAPVVGDWDGVTAHGIGVTRAWP